MKSGMKLNSEHLAEVATLNPIQNGFFRGSSRIGWRQKDPPSLTSVTYIIQC